MDVLADIAWSMLNCPRENLFACISYSLDFDNNEIVYVGINGLLTGPINPNITKLKSLDHL